MEARTANKYDVLMMFKIMDKLPDDESVFIKSSKKRIKEMVKKNKCFVVEEDGEMLGFLLGCFPLDSSGVFYIDTIVSTKDGGGTLLIKEVERNLEHESFIIAHVSEKNSRSIGMFSKNGFRPISNDFVYGNKRILIGKLI